MRRRERQPPRLGELQEAAVRTRDPSGNVWASGGKPYDLFTSTLVEIGGTKLAVGAYTIAVFPKRWTSIILKNTAMSGEFDEKMDLGRRSMESGKLLSPEPQPRGSALPMPFLTTAACAWMSRQWAPEPSLTKGRQPSSLASDLRRTREWIHHRSHCVFDNMRDAQHCRLI